MKQLSKVLSISKKDIFKIMDSTIYNLLLWALPILLAILGFIGALAVNALMKLAHDVGEIKTAIGVVSNKHENLEQRLERIEDKIFA